jgi:hypothetical protein
MYEPSEPARELLSYLVERPRSKDTLEGRVEWWLFRQEIEKRVREARNAVAELVDRGLIVERKGKDGRSLYRLNPRKTKEIRDLCEKQ